MPKGQSTPGRWDMNDFSLGYDNNSPATMLDPRNVADCKNFNLTNKKGLSKRGGMTRLYGTTAGTGKDVEQLYEYKAPNGTNYVLVAIDTFIKSYYSSQWNPLKTGLTAGLNYSFVTHLGSCYIANGTNANVRLYNTTAYNVGIPVPAAAPTVGLGTGTLNGDYYYKYCYMRDVASGIGYEQVGNPSAASALIQPAGANGVDVTFVASTDSNVKYIWLYRTLNGGSTYYKQGVHANASATVTDNTVDNSLTTVLNEENDAPYS